MSSPPQAFKQEFIQGSAIAPALFAATVAITPDTITRPGGDASYPIHEALNWRLTRFGRQARATNWAALLVNEDGSCWQAKLSAPLMDASKGKARKYEAPVGSGSKPYLPPVPADIRAAVGQRYSVDVPLNGSFWQWLEQHPEIPIILTEGGKKALALLSLGYVAIALYGVYGGYQSKDRLGNPIRRQLIPELLPFCSAGRQVVLAFDQDSKPSTRAKVARALIRFGALLGAAGCDGVIASWDAGQGKGADDLIVNAGAEAMHQAIAEAWPVEHWQILQRLQGQLSYPVALQANQADLSSLDISQLPEQGIIAIVAAKGTGKTKLIGQAVAGAERAIATGHRIALMRNLCQRLQLDYRGDLDRAAGQFITSAGYTLRVGAVVDSLLAIHPDQFSGCDLVIDELVQVLRHLLTSSTCAKEGKRPALLARFRQLLQAARRVIVADADLDNASLDYIRQLRGDDSPVFLIRNDYQPQGYPVRFIEAGNRSAIIDDLLADIKALELGKVLFVATDSRATSRAIDRLIAQQCPDKRVLLINSDTSSGDFERAFIQSPDQHLAGCDVVIATPSMATGVSIEAQGIISRVYGIFTGVSSTDADMAQALGRVREPVERIVWCAKRGRNYCKASRATNFLELKNHLASRTSATASLIRANLTEANRAALRSYDWASDPHTNLYAKISAAQNASMLHLRAALLVRLKHEGNAVIVEDRKDAPTIGELMKAAGQALKAVDAEAIANAPALTRPEIEALEQKESLELDERLAIARYYLVDFYALPDITPDDVLWDKDGRRRRELLELEAQLYPDSATDRTARGIERQTRWQQGITPWDISGAALRRALRAEISLDEFLDPDREWTATDVAKAAARARELSQQIKTALNFTITDSVSNVQLIHQLLSRLGIKLSFRWASRDSQGKRHRIYRLDAAYWSQLMAILQRRTEKRQSLQQQESDTGSPPPKNSLEKGGDPVSEPWLTPDSLADIRAMIAAADSSDSLAELWSFIPIAALQAAGAS